MFIRHQPPSCSGILKCFYSRAPRWAFGILVIFAWVGAPGAQAAKLADPGSLPGVFVGTSNSSNYGGIAVAPNGDVIVVGDTFDPDLPVTDLSTNNNGDIFVARFDAKMREIKWFEYLGGSDYDQAFDVAVDSSGNVYVAGWGSSDFPVTGGAYDTSASSGAMVVFELSGSTGAMIWSTFFEEDFGFQDMAVDSSGRVVLAGYTDGDTLVEVNDFGGDSYLRDAAVVRFSAGGSSLELSSYYGGGKKEEARAVATAGSNIYLFVHLEDYETGAEINRILKVSPGSISWEYDVNAVPAESSAGYFIVEDIATTDSGLVIVAGTIEDFYNDLPSIDPARSPLGVTDLFVGQVNSTGTDLNWITYLGGSDSESGARVAVGTSNTVFVGGATASTDYPLLNGIFGIGVSTATKLTSAGDQILWSTVYGGSSNFSRDIATDGEVAVVGGLAPVPSQLPVASILAFGDQTPVFAARLEPLPTGRFLPRRSVSLPELDRVVEPLPAEGLDIDGDGVVEAVIDLVDRSLDPAWGSMVLDRYGDGRDLVGVGIGSLGGARPVGILDLDLDGEPELVVEDPRRDAGTVEGWLLDTADLDVDLLVIGRGGVTGGLLVDLDGDLDVELVVGAPHLANGQVSRMNLDYPADNDADVIFIGGIPRAILDIDGDGEMEVVAERGGTGGTVSYGSVEGTPDADDDILFLAGTYSFARDLDDDGLPEIFAANGAASPGTASVVDQVVFLGGEPRVTADIDNDSELEVIGANPSASQGTMSGLDVLDGVDYDDDVIFVGGQFRGAFDFDHDHEPELVVEDSSADPDTVDVTDHDADDDTDLVAVGGSVVAAVDLDDDGEWEIVGESGSLASSNFVAVDVTDNDADSDKDVIFLGGTLAGFADLDQDWEFELIAEAPGAASGTFDPDDGVEASADGDNDVIFLAGEWRVTHDFDEDGEPEVLSEDSGLGSAKTASTGIESDTDRDVLFVKAAFLNLLDYDGDGEPEIVVADSGVSPPSVSFDDFIEASADSDEDLIRVPENGGFAVADLDGDGELELIVEREGGSAGVTNVVNGDASDVDICFVGGIPELVFDIDHDGEWEVVVEAAIGTSTASAYYLVENPSDLDPDVVYVGGTAHGHADLDGDGEDEVVVESGSAGSMSMESQIDEFGDPDPDVVFTGGVVRRFFDVDFDGDFEAFIENTAATPGTFTRANEVDATSDSDPDLIFHHGRVSDFGDLDSDEAPEVAIVDPDFDAGTAVDLQWDAFAPFDGVIAGVDSSAGSPSLTLTSPNGGGSTTLGDPLAITWTASGFSGTIRIELSRDNGASWEVLFTSTDNDGVEYWTSAGDPTTDALIRITSRNLADPVNDVSAATFTLSL